MNLPKKSDVLEALYNSLNERKADIIKQINTVQESINSDEKSSAGDKYETSRAMGQIEIDRLRIQLSQINTQEVQLRNISAKYNSDTIKTGSLVQLKDKIIFVSIAFGKFSVNELEMIAISPSSPIAQALVDHKQGDTISFNGSTISILEVK